MQISKPQSKQINWERKLTRLEGAYADSTLCAYRADVETFVSWCERRGRRPLPASPKLLASFVENEAKRCSVATIKRRLAAIGKIHRLMKLENPVENEDVKLALRRALRKKSARPRQALGLTRELREQLIAACDDSLSGKRDRAILAIGYDTLARRSEIVSLRVEDITQTARGAKLIIRRAKNDQLGLGRVAHISHSALGYLEEWLKAARIVSGPLFRSIKSGTISGSSLHPHSIGVIIKRAAKSAGLSSAKIKQLSGHSMRVGAAQDMMTSGLDILPIMAAGGWKTTNVVARYIENADISPLLRAFYS
jgi:integrase/recombinase XerD